MKEWYILLDPTNDMFIVMSDFAVLRNARSACWLKDLAFTSIGGCDISIAGYLEYNTDLKIFHKFTSDNPLSYVSNIHTTHPELFI